MIIHFLCVLIFISSAFSADADIESSPASRKPRLFYVYTDKTTSTVLSNSFCYMQGTGLTACTASGRKKRAPVDSDLDLDVDISASTAEDYDDEIDKDHSKLIDSAMEEASERNYREDKVLLYWLTTTSISTKYSYTRTLTVASITCTPTGWPVSTCG